MNRRKFLFAAIVGSGASLGGCGGGDPLAAPVAAASSGGSTPPPPGLTPSPPTIPLTGQSPVPLFLTWDGGSGPSRDTWSKKLGLTWRNAGTGDWLDAGQLPQGSRAYVTGTVTAGNWVELAVTELARRWATSGMNRGFFLRSQSTSSVSLTFVGRTASDSTRRPKLTVVTDQGTFNPPCICNAHFDASTSQSFDTRAEFRVASNPIVAIVQFDMKEVRGAVQSATLALFCSTLSGSGGVAVFEADPPPFRVGGGSEPPRQGIASAYLWDRGLSSHSSVLFASDFSSLGKEKWQQGDLIAGTQQVVDSNSQSTYLRSLFRAGEVGSCTLTRSLALGNSQGLPTTVETELYGRYYVYLEDNWGSAVDWNKMPGWDGRYGWWSTANGGYWNATTGNGGSPPTGLKVWNATQQKWEYQGASMRGTGGNKIGDGNPYDDSIFWLASYLYHLDQDGPYGELIKWNGTMIGKGRWYCIEHYCKMNSISAPYDANGNGTANKDGVYRVWVDGVMVWERSDLRWRRHPEMGLQGFWLNWYHGGVNPPSSAMNYRMNHVVIARQYIGPRRES